jgi:hypothetical protein
MTEIIKSLNNLHTIKKMRDDRIEITHISYPLDATLVYDQVHEFHDLADETLLNEGGVHG